MEAEEVSNFTIFGGSAIGGASLSHRTWDYLENGAIDIKWNPSGHHGFGSKVKFGHNVFIPSMIFCHVMYLTARSYQGTPRECILGCCSLGLRFRSSKEKSVNIITGRGVSDG